MSAIVNQNFTKHAGDDILIQFLVEDLPDLESFSLRWVMCIDDPDTDPQSPILLDKSNTGSNPQISTSDNIVFVSIPSEETDKNSSIQPGRYYHELHGLDSEGKGGVLGSGVGTLLPTRIGR